MLTHFSPPSASLGTVGDTHQRGTQMARVARWFGGGDNMGKWVLCGLIFVIGATGCGSAGSPSEEEILSAKCGGEYWVDYCAWTVVSIDAATSGEVEGVGFWDVDYTMRAREPSDETCKWFKHRFVYIDPGGFDTSSWVPIYTSAPPDTCE